MRVSIFLRAFMCVLSLVAARVGGQTFLDETVARGLGAPPPVPLSYGLGACWADLDGDGDMDLINPGNPGVPIGVFRNDAGQFTLISAPGFGVAVGFVRGMFAADITNNGFPDVLICYAGAGTQLWINHGGLVFSEEAALRGISNVSNTTCAAFGDYDRDGWLDIYVGNYVSLQGFPEANKLYRNSGAGVFSEVTLPAGVGDMGFSLAVTFLDYDMDGWPDIYCANDRGGAGIPNALYRNLGNGSFLNVAPSLNANLAADSMGVDFVDAFNDGGYDIYVSDNPPSNHFSEWNQASLTYATNTAQYGLQSGPQGCWAVKFLDYDNDGWQDLLSILSVSKPDLFRNPGMGSGGGLWTEVATAEGLSAPYAKLSAATVDVDDDGHMDLFLRYHQGLGYIPPRGLGLYRNQGLGGNWIKIRLEGAASNRDGLGSHVIMTAGGMTQRQQSRSGVGYLMNNDPRIHFGLGSAALVDRLEIRWPSGIIQVLHGLAANQILHVREPTFQFAGSLSQSTGMLVLDSPNEANLIAAIALSLTANAGIPLPDGRLVPLDADWLFTYSLNAPNALLSAPIALIGLQGVHSCAVTVPLTPQLTGLPFYTTGITYHPASGPGTTFGRAVSLVIP